MLEQLAQRMHGATGLMDVEERGLRGLFRYIVENPGFYRLLNEAETLAPKAHGAHFRNVADAYTHSLHAAWARGELPGYDEAEIPVLAYMLMGIRSYLILGFARKGRAIAEPPEAVIQTYLKFARAGFRAG